MAFVVQWPRLEVAANFYPDVPELPQFSVPRNVPREDEDRGDPGIQGRSSELETRVGQVRAHRRHR